jgi:2-keto-3-deoxy-L-rhamnonate aldolase RhmA
MRNNPLRIQLKAGRTTYGMWVTLESPNVLEAATALGIDWVVIEMEHGHLDWSDVVNHLRVVSGTQTAAIVRVPELRREPIQRALDLGADGILVPMVSRAESLEQAFSLGRYPPRGVRGVAGERCVKWGLETADYLRTANDETLIIPLLETREAVEQVESILSVDGLEAIYFGPADMSASYGFLGQWEGGPVADSIRTMRELATARGIASGILARSRDEAVQRRAEGFQMIAIGADVNLMMSAIRDTLNAVHNSAS